jgi:hypothetical protein
VVTSKFHSSSYFPWHFTRFDLHARSEITLRDIRDFEALYHLPILRIKNIPLYHPSENRSEISEVAPILNMICECLWQRDLMLAGKLTNMDEEGQQLSYVWRPSNSVFYLDQISYVNLSWDMHLADALCIVEAGSYFRSGNSCLVSIFLMKLFFYCLLRNYCLSSDSLKEKLIASCNKIFTLRLDTISKCMWCQKRRLVLTLSLLSQFYK